jgi:hypothetical protein
LSTSPSSIAALRFCFVWVCVLLAPTRLPGIQDCPSPRVIPRDELLQAMRQHGNYDIVPTPNWARFQTEVFLNLMHASLARDSRGGVILIPAEDWYQAYVEVARLTPGAIHEGTRLAREVGQTTLLDFRRDGVIRRADTVPLNWPPTPASSGRTRSAARRSVIATRSPTPSYR